MQRGDDGKRTLKFALAVALEAGGGRFETTSRQRGDDGTQTLTRALAVALEAGGGLLGSKCWGEGGGGLRLSGYKSLLRWKVAIAVANIA
jgi:hypothetical protein